MNSASIYVLMVLTIAIGILLMFYFKNREITLVITAIMLLLVILEDVIFIFFKTTSKAVKAEFKDPINQLICNDFLGGSFLINFNTNGGEILEGMSVCVSCAPDSYKDLPIPTKQGSTFNGWYYDENFTSKVEVTNSLNISPIPKLDSNGCKIGYENITLFAKWN